MKNIIFIVLAMFTFGQAATAQQLTRTEAERIVKDFVEPPYVAYTTIQTMALGNPYKNSKAAGLLEFSMAGLMATEHAFSETGKRYVISGQKVALGIMDFKEIIGIKMESEYVAIIEFSCTSSNLTPFGKSGDFKIPTQSGVKVQRYDDGWRPLGSKSKIYHPKDLPFYAEYAIQAQYKTAFDKAAQQPFDYTQTQSFRFQEALLGEESKVRFTFTDGCSTCEPNEVNVFMNAFAEKLSKAPRIAQVIDANDAITSVQLSVSSINFNKIVMPSLTVKVQTVYFDSDSRQVLTGELSFYKSHSKGDASREQLFFELIEQLQKQINEQFYNLIPIQTTVQSVGVPNKKGYIKELIINKPLYLLRDGYDVIIFSESGSEVKNGVTRIHKVRSTGRIKSTGWGSTLSVKLKKGDPSLKSAFDNGEKLYVIIAKKL